MTHVSHGSLQGAPTESSENLTETKLISTLLGQIDLWSISRGQIPLRIRKDMEKKLFGWVATTFSLVYLLL